MGIGSYIWRLLQAVSEAGWDRFKISPQPDAPTLVEAMRTVYSPVPVPTPSPDVEMAIDAPEAEEVAFTLVTNKKRKGKDKIPSPLFFFFFVHQFITQYLVAVCGRLSTIGSLQF